MESAPKWRTPPLKNKKQKKSLWTDVVMSNAKYHAKISSMNFLSHVKDVLTIISRYFLRPFLFFSRTPIIQMFLCLMLSRAVWYCQTNFFFFLFCSLTIVSTILLISSSSLIFLLQLICYRFFLGYFSFQLLCCSLLFVL